MGIRHFFGTISVECPPSCQSQHERMRSSSPLVGMGKVQAPQDKGTLDSEVEISHGQKMLSAVSGSLLTSLLGRHPTQL